MSECDGQFLLFCKEDPDRSPEYRWCGVVVAQRPVEHGDGEVIDAVMRATEAALLSWFDGWQDGWRAAEFDSARKDK